MRYGIVAVLLVAGCGPMPGPDPNLPIVRDYRAPGDVCKFVGESSVTIDYLDDAADLVACPTEYDGLQDFMSETGAIEVGRYREFTFFSVPYR